MFSSCPSSAFVAGVKSGSASFADSRQARGEPVAADLARALVVFPARTREVAAHDALDGEDLGAADEHRAAAQQVFVLTKRLGHLGDIGRDEVVRRDAREALEPEARERGEHFAFARDLRREDAVEGGDAVGGDDEQVVFVHLVHVAHLAAPQ